MRIAILTSGILPVPAVQGGAVENLVDFYLQYNDRQHLHDITVYSVWHPAVEHHPARDSEVNHYVYFKVHTFWAKLRKHLYKYTHSGTYYHYTIAYFLHQAIRELRHQQFDIIILENRPAYALKLKACTDARLVYHLHNEKLDNRVPQYLDIYHAASRILTVSDYIKSRVLTINPADSKTLTIHNGIDLAAFGSNAQRTPHPAGRQHSTTMQLVFSGRVTEQKGIMQLIDAMCRLSNYPDIKLLVIGSSFYGNADNENLFAETLRRKAEPLKDRITFTGFVPYSAMPDYLRSADVAIIPSVWDDPFPTTVLEAQAVGLPIITTRRGGIPEQVTGDNAILLETDDHFTERLADAILHLYDHPEKRQRMAEASLKRAELFDKETYARNFFAALT